MHAIVTRVTVTDAESATENLRGEVVPRVSQAPGFVAGYWVRLEGADQGASVVVFESEEAARSAAEHIRAGVEANPGVTLNDVTVGEVVANA